jgi:hypothetical protein
MPFNYQEFKIVTEDIQDTPVGWEAMSYNNDILRSGLKDEHGICVSMKHLRDASLHEIRTYREFIPPFFTLGRVEEYVNGALNIFVRNKEGKPVGAIVVRPLTL